MKKKNKYKPGAVVKTMVELDYWLGHGDKWVYLHQRVMHSAFLESMQYRTVKGFVKSRCIKKALLNQGED